MNSQNIHKPISLQDLSLEYTPAFLDSKLSDLYFESLFKNLHWEQHAIKIFGKTIPQPRLTALYSTNSQLYTYSGLTLIPTPFNKELNAIHSKIIKQTGHTFTHCLANLYRDGNDSMGWHTDDEKELGKDPIIASLSLGEVRNFQLKHKKIKN